MPDLVKAVKGRRKNLRKIWSGKDWKAKKAAFLKDHPNCAMHLDCWRTVPATIPHHPYKTSYKGHYTDLELSGCVPYCNRCHFALHKGLRLCRVCAERYHRWDSDMCWPCFCAKNPDIVKKIEESRIKTKKIQKELRDTQKKKVQAWKAENKKVSK